MQASEYLQPGRSIESDACEVVDFAEQVTRGIEPELEKAVALYYAVRDGISYDPYDQLSMPQAFSAKRALLRKRGFCIPKAALLAACARAVGIYARLGFADVRNHLASRKMLEYNGGDHFRWHAYTELFLHGRWVKATPAFDQRLCQRARIKPLEFDGLSDSIFHPYDAKDRMHMEYIRDHGPFADVPFEKITEDWRLYSPKLLEDSYFSNTNAFLDEVSK